ncbi:antitoxin [Mycobacterium aquaticum]|uniref:Antitoxin n=1 Tax=Mycobacterium aquaticum TaxID=1927124 RepID=A0A1X0A275_9MYCO|nr:antitoxin [Mycobacterium aquaticum]ORA24149.1 antitoxin [Mycobacterium aquaticum]
MPKERMPVTSDGAVHAVAAAEAKGSDRPEQYQQAPGHEHLRIALQDYTAHTVPALNIADHAQQIYQANQAAGL